MSALATFAVIGGSGFYEMDGISDVERVEMQYPLVYLARNHNPDGFGYGRWQGGAGSWNRDWRGDTSSEFRISTIYRRGNSRGHRH